MRRDGHASNLSIVEGQCSLMQEDQKMKAGTGYAIFVFNAKNMSDSLRLTLFPGAIYVP